MAQALTRQPLPTKDWAWSQTSPCRICGVQTGTRAGFSLRISVLPWQYHSNNNSYLFIHPSPILYNVFNQHIYKKCKTCNTQTSKLCNPILTILLLHICTVKSCDGLSCQLQVTRVFHIFLNFAFSWLSYRVTFALNLITYISRHYTHLTSFHHELELRYECTIKQLGHSEITLAFTHSLTHSHMLSKTALPATRQETKVKGCKTRSITRNEKQQKIKSTCMRICTPYNSNFWKTRMTMAQIFSTLSIQKCRHGVTSPLKHTASILPIKGTYLDCSGGGSSWHCCTVTRLHRELNTAWHHLPVCTSRWSLQGCEGSLHHTRTCQQTSRRVNTMQTQYPMSFFRDCKFPEMRCFISLNYSTPIRIEALFNQKQPTQTPGFWRSFRQQLSLCSNNKFHSWVSAWSDLLS